MENFTQKDEKKGDFGPFKWKLWAMIAVAFCVIAYSSYKNMESFGGIVECDDGIVLGVKIADAQDSNDLTKLNLVFYGVSDKEKMANLVEGGIVFDESQKILAKLPRPNADGGVEIALKDKNTDKYVYFLITNALVDKKPAVLRIKNPHYKK